MKLTMNKCHSCHYVFPIHITMKYKLNEIIRGTTVFDKIASVHSCRRKIRERNTQGYQFKRNKQRTLAESLSEIQNANLIKKKVC